MYPSTRVLLASGRECRIYSWHAAVRRPLVEKIESANKQAIRRIVQAEPVLIDVQPASAVMPKLGPKMILHAGPPITWDRMCGPMRGAVCGIAVFEGWAKDLAQAEAAAAAGEYEFHPNHHFGAVGPM